MLNTAPKSGAPSVLPLGDVEIKKVESLEAAYPILWHTPRAESSHTPGSDGKKLSPLREHTVGTDQDIQLVVEQPSTLITDAKHVVVGERDGKRHVTLKDAGFCLVMDPKTARVTDRYLTPRCTRELKRLTADDFGGVTAFLSLKEGAILPTLPEEPQLGTLRLPDRVKKAG